MRKIEKEMIAAIDNNVEDWTKGNTRVHRVIGGMEVQLHGNRIATVDSLMGVIVDKKILKQYPTNTTKSRLRALGVDVYHKAGELFLSEEKI